jgi:hypothetical protein
MIKKYSEEFNESINKTVDVPEISSIDDIFNIPHLM